MEGKGYAAIRDYLNAEGIITPKNHRNRLAMPARPHDPESKWSDATVRDILRSQVLRGYQARENGTIVRDSDGNPVRAGESLVDDDVWFGLQVKLDELARAGSGKPKRKDGHPLLGILVCEHCTKNAYHLWEMKRTKLRVYGQAIVSQVKAVGLPHAYDEASETLTVTVPGRAADVVEAVRKVARSEVEEAKPSGPDVVAFHAGKLRVSELTALWEALELGDGLDDVTRKRHVFYCKGVDHAPDVTRPSIDFDDTLTWVDEGFMRRLGRLHRTEVVTTGGRDNRPAIKELESDIEALGGQLTKLRGVAADMVANQLNGLSDRLEELKKEPCIPPQRRTVRLAHTWGDDWKHADWTARHEMLVSAGVKIWLRNMDRRLQPVGERLRMEIGTHVDPARDALDDVAYQESP